MFDSKEMFELGVAFLNAGEVNFREGAVKYRSTYQNVAGVVNLAFACELFIKCLLNMAGLKISGHKLADLWSQYKDECIDNATEIETAVMNKIATGLTFEEMLQNDSNVFYNYRYIFDPERLAEIRKKPLLPQFLRVFSFEMNQFISEKLS